MFLRYYVDLDTPFPQVESRLLDDPARWVPAILTQAEDRGTELLADVGFAVREDHRVDKLVEVHVGEPYRVAGKTMVPVTWTATGSEGLFPSLEADVEIAPLGERRSHLSISARYEPPLGVLGRVLDRALLHRVAEATVRDFVDRIVEQIGAIEHAPVR